MNQGEVKWRRKEREHTDITEQLLHVLGIHLEEESRI